jgi:ferritin
LEFTQRLDKTIADKLNSQIKYELENSHAYKAIAAWCSNGPWANAYKYFFKRGLEEQEHANKIIEYLDSKNCSITIPAIGMQEHSFGNIKEILTKSLQREIDTTGQWQDISNSAISAKDTTTLFLSTWFVNEQISEESEFRDLLYKIALGMPDWELENIFAELNEG